MSDRYAVMGHPIAHSRSPWIHACFATATGEDLRYEAIHVQPGEFDAAVSVSRAAGGRGLNVTLPFKQEAWALADRRTPRAERAGAVNTLWFEGEHIGGDNTDGVGLVRDIGVNLGWPLGGRRVLLLGAGGAARGVLEPLLAARPAEVVIANRTETRAHELAARFTTLGNLRGSAFAALDGGFDLLVNATSASLQGEVPALPDGVLGADAACYDMMYAAGPTAFLRWAKAAGATRLTDGVGMLVEQAAESFARWRGVRPPTGAVIAGLRELLGGG